MKKTRDITILCAVVVFLMVGFGGGRPAAGGTLVMASPAFANGEQLPAEFTCRGAGISPPLVWRGAPVGTRSLALICEDPDAPAGTYIHWLVYEIPASITSLRQGIKAPSQLPPGAKQGRNDAHGSGYFPACPPAGEHRYYFRLFALNKFTDLKKGATKAELLRVMEGHILDEATLLGRFGR
ncbi:MAG: YbhB/YbcL family Raf kinase inhibitor-like protein [Smithellaceae bacterium]|nr:YbhB/YbcL family Raf kinase inhibitor-like protein [Smithellaceae bacterium]